MLSASSLLLSFRCLGEAHLQWPELGSPQLAPEAFRENASYTPLPPLLLFQSHLAELKHSLFSRTFAISIKRNETLQPESLVSRCSIVTSHKRTERVGLKL